MIMKHMSRAFWTFCWTIALSIGSGVHAAPHYRPLPGEGYDSRGQLHNKRAEKSLNINVETHAAYVFTDKTVRATGALSKRFTWDGDPLPLKAGINFGDQLLGVHAGIIFLDGINASLNLGMHRDFDQNAWRFSFGGSVATW